MNITAFPVSSLAHPEKLVSSILLIVWGSTIFSKMWQELNALALIVTISGGNSILAILLQFEKADFPIVLIDELSLKKTAVKLLQLLK